MDPAKTMPSSMRQRTDYGLKIAKKGYDVFYASDNQLLYNSSFPVLQIVDMIKPGILWEVVATGAYTYLNQDTGATSTRYQHKVRHMHGFGYPPMVVPMTYTYDKPSDSITWNEKYIYGYKDFANITDYNNFIAGGANFGNWIVFGVDIETDIEYPYTSSALDTEWGQVYDYGIKHILTDNPETKNAADLGLNANIQSLLVVAVKVATYAKKAISQYLPDDISASELAPFCFIKSFSSGLWRAGGVSSQSIAGFIPAMPALGTNYYTLDGQLLGDKCSLVVVRLPMISSDKTDYSFNM